MTSTKVKDAIEALDSVVATKREPAAAALQAAADKKNTLDAKLRDLDAEERVLTQQITRAVADNADPKALAGPKAKRATLREQIEDLEGAQRHLTADYEAAQFALDEAVKSARREGYTALIRGLVREAAATYTAAAAAYLQARREMRAMAADVMPTQENSVYELIDQVISYALHGTPANEYYAKPFAELIEKYLDLAITDVR